MERRPDPAAYKAMCTHFIQPSATPTLERLGLDTAIETAGGVRNGIEAWTRYGWVRPRPGTDYPYPRYGYDIRREKLDPMMRGMAARTDGVDLLLGATATDLLRICDRPSGVRVRDRHGDERELSARVVVGADGRNSRVARMANVRARVRPHGRFSYFAYYRDLPLVSGERTLFWFKDPDVAYAFPQDDGLTLLAVFLTKDQLSWFKRDLETNFESYFKGLPNAPDLAAATRTSKVLGKLDLPNTYRRAGLPGLAFVGDAAMAADPVWGVGCGWALQSGEWLADELGGALARAGAEDDEVDAAIERYRRRHRRALLPHFMLTSGYSSGRRFNALERLLFSASAKDDRTAEGFHAFSARSVGPGDSAFAKTIVRAVFVSATRRNGADAAEPQPPHDERQRPPASVERSRITVQGVTVPLSAVGPGDSEEAVVFVHGNPGSSRDWDDLLARVAPFARAVALDMPGFGRSQRPRSFDYTVAGYATFLKAPLEHLAIERAHVVLHDFGGLWGLEWAVQNPERLASAERRCIRAEAAQLQ